uniref:protein-histidine N-methyltransferase n=1 Tax=Ciona savignyi TaxID=51511 RepID=H2ZQA2_CIOSA
MDFKFNFSAASDEPENKKENIGKKQDKNLINLQKYQHFTLDDIQNVWRNSSESEVCCIECVNLTDGTEIHFMQTYTDVCKGSETSEPTKVVSKKTGEFTIPDTIDSSDLVSKVYEGGLKVWESSLDLVEFLGKPENKSFFADASVLEVGCGIGLPGILASKYGAKKVVFQDYNDFVLFNTTGPSVILNQCQVKDDEDSSAPEAKRIKTDGDLMACFERVIETEKKIDTKCQYSFIGGDWEEIAKNIDEKFDIVLTAETIYDVTNYEKLHLLLERCVGPNGMIFLAAKSFYFGVGGGISLWIEFVENKKVFEVIVVELIDAPVKREILKMKRLTQKTGEK